MNSAEELRHVARPRPPQESRLRAATDAAVYNAVRFETLRQHFAHSSRPCYDPDDRVDAWRWLHVAHEFAGARPFAAGFLVTNRSEPAPCCAPAQLDGVEPCGDSAHEEVRPVARRGAAARVPLCPAHLAELRATYVSDAAPPAC